MTSSPQTNVKCDWLDVTFSPDDWPRDEAREFLHSVCGEVMQGSTVTREKWRVGQGVVVLETRARWARVSASGGALDELRFRGQFLSYLSLLGEQPHTVTRLDACLDSEAPGPDVVADLRRRYPARCALTRKAQPTKVFLSANPEGRETGTFYVAHRSEADVAARVYDKRQQLWEVHGTEIGHPWTRYELTIKKSMGPTLRDAAQPERVFWHFAAPTLLVAPVGVEPWQPGWGTGWEYRAPEPTSYERLKRRVEASAEIGALIELSDALGPRGRDWLISLIASRAGLRKAG